MNKEVKYVGPGGVCCPCYALMGKRNDTYRQVTVGSSEQCRACTLRYVCGGYCRAWGPTDNHNGSLAGCTALYKRARSLLVSSLEALDVSVARWQVADLPLPK